MARETRVVEEPVHSNGYKKQDYKLKIIWWNAIKFSFLHTATLYGVYLIFASANWRTSLFALVLVQLGILGITAGAHRLWSHRSYKAKWPLRVFLCILNCISYENSIYYWCRDHRVHHKFTDTDADPHNSKRGFFFSHIGWLMCKKHPDVIKKGKSVFLDDVLADPIVRFQRRFYTPLAFLFSYYLPTMIPVWCWNETAWNSFFISAIARHIVRVHCIFFVNSVGHKYGDRPFDKYMEARDNPVAALLTLGEGWHNYHHTFPWDYAASELGYTLNLTKFFIDVMAMIGQAYDLKTADSHTIRNRKLKSGDGKRLSINENPEFNYTAQDRN